MLPEDLMRFGLIPEFIGRLPVVGAVRQLDREMLVRVLTEPKNSLVRQFQRVFELDAVALELTDDALEAVADLALLRGTGARGLRAILEEVLLDVMYDLPGPHRRRTVRRRRERRAGPRGADARAGASRPARAAPPPDAVGRLVPGARRGARVARRPRRLRADRADAPRRADARAGRRRAARAR